MNSVESSGEKADDRTSATVMELDPENDARDALATLRRFVLSDVPPNSQRQVESWVEFDSYIADLCSHGLDTLTREPDALSMECARLRTQLEEVSCSNYRALLESFECAGTVRDGVGKIRSRLDLLIDALPTLAKATREFSSNAAEVQIEREAKLRTLAEYGRVVDILEMPRLMRSLVAGELYEEALELRDTSFKLASMHRDESLLLALSKEVDALTRQMVLQLVGLLRNPIQLPDCLRVVGFLRRLSIFPEHRLRMLFLQCRGEAMNSALEAGMTCNAQAKLVHLCDDTRAMVFEIITQYRAAFAEDDDESVESVSVSDRFAEHPNGVGTGTGRVACQFPSGAILSNWASSNVSQLMTKLEEGLDEIRDGVSLATVMQQAMYCGESLGRVGSDFRPALVPLFECTILRIVNSHLNSALRQFEMMIGDHRWAPVGCSALRKSRVDRDTAASSGRVAPRSGEASEGIVENIAVVNVEEPSVSCSHSPFEPPITVLDSPPLAVFLNGLLAALNELRSCALLSLCSEVARCVTDTLLLAAECMSSVGGPAGAFLKASDRQYFDAMHSSFVSLCVPHVARCLDHCMGQRGLVEVDKIVAEMADLFGEPVKHLTIPPEEPHVVSTHTRMVDHATEHGAARFQEGRAPEEVVAPVRSAGGAVVDCSRTVPSMEIDPKVNVAASLDGGS